MLDLTLYMAALNSTRDGLIITENRGSENPIIYANPAFLALSGYSSEEVLGKDCRFLQGAQIDQDVIDQIRQAIKAETSTLVTLRNYRKDGSLFWNELSISPIKDSAGNTPHFVGIQKDVTEQVELRQKLEQKNKKLHELNNYHKEQSKIDSLTQLYNRKILDDKVSLLWNTAQRSRSRFNIFFIDIDHFKSINDTYGHQTGDICLQALSSVLKDHFKRPTDVLIRYGGEEFMVVTFALEKIESEAIANHIKQEIEALAIQTPINQEIKITASIGVYCFVPEIHQTLDNAIHQADQAMYQAKIRGRNQVYIQCECSTEPNCKKRKS